MQVKELHNGKVLHLDEGHCEGLGVVDEGTQQQSLVLAVAFIARENMDI